MHLSFSHQVSDKICESHTAEVKWRMKWPFYAFHNPYTVTSINFLPIPAYSLSHHLSLMKFNLFTSMLLTKSLTKDVLDLILQLLNLISPLINEIMIHNFSNHQLHWSKMVLIQWKEWSESQISRNSYFRLNLCTRGPEPYRYKAYSYHADVCTSVVKSTIDRYKALKILSEDN